MAVPPIPHELVAHLQLLAYHLGKGVFEEFRRDWEARGQAKPLIAYVDGAPQTTIVNQVELSLGLGGGRTMMINVPEGWRHVDLTPTIGPSAACTRRSSSEQATTRRICSKSSSRG
jgi:hypothetical protein